MRIGPKFKIARRLGSPIFEKTQTEKYAASLARKEKAGKINFRPKSEFGIQLIEKQKARLTYGLTEKQFRKYAKEALSTSEPMQRLFKTLESRLDNILFRSGFARTRAQARQMASHGHTRVNGRRVTIPSILLKENDVVGVGSGSAGSPLFAESAERMKTSTTPAWLKLDSEKREAEVIGTPTYTPTEHVFDLSRVLEYYNK